MIAGKDCHGDHTICEIVETDWENCVEILYCCCQDWGINYECSMEIQELEGCSPS